MKKFGVHQRILLKGNGSTIFRAMILSILFPTSILSLTSCASLSQKLSDTEVANIGIFADHTIAMLSEEDLGFSRDQAIYIREYYEVDGKEEKAFQKYRDEAALVFRGIIDYSLKLVTIADTGKSEKEKIKAYAEYISGWDDDVLQKLGLAPDYYAEVISDVRAKETFLDALRTAQPLINSAGRWMNQVLDNLSDATYDLAMKIDKMIDEEYLEVRLYQENLEEEKYNILRSFGKIYRIYRGDEKAFKELLDLNTIRKKGLIPDSSPNNEELNKLTEYFMSRLDALHKIEDEIKPDWELYRASHHELDEMHAQVLNKISRARIITLIWLRAHQKMASGEVAPAEWFNISSLPTDLFKLGTKAIF